VLTSIFKRTTDKLNNDSCISTLSKDEPCPQSGLEMDFSNYAPQGGIAEQTSITVGEIDSHAKYQNVRFSDQPGDTTLVINSDIDSTRTLQDTHDTNLEHFFKRPIKIYETEWGTSLSLYDFFDPWTLFFTNPRVINRIANFALLRCKLKLKFVINGNSFHYGRAYAAYQPLWWEDIMTQNRIISQDNINLTQLPKIFLDPTLSQGGEMTLPFFWHENYLDIVNQDWSDMGLIILRSLNNLQHANGATDQVTISVFAWAEDVELSVLTSVEPGGNLTPQGGDEVDEAQGKISGPATAIAKAAGHLSSIPSIAPFAMATQMTANTVAGVAKALGYSRPTVDPTPRNYVNRPMGSLALTNVYDTSAKLSVDNKQELSIDPRITGLDGVDQMSIKSIAAREAYLTQFTWGVDKTPESFLWNARVDPCQFGETGTEPIEYHLTPSCIAALPFRYWTGTMKFRFQIVASAFHRGRLKIAYDPKFLATNEYNTNYTNVIDISETRDFTIEVGVGQTTTLINHHKPGEDSFTQLYSTTPYTSKEAGNGVIGVYVVNKLSIPNSAINSDITVNVYVSMGDDFEVFVPDDYFTKLKPGLQSETLVPQGGTEPHTEDTEEPSAPIHEQSELLGLGTTNNDMINKVYTGESIVSFRQLLKRYTYFRTVPMLTTDNFARLVYEQSMYPFWPGYVPDAVDTTSINVPYNYCAMTLWHWVAMCYAGIRGGMRYKIHAARTDDMENNNTLVTNVTRLNGIVPYSRGITSISTPGSVSRANRDTLHRLYNGSGAMGMNVTFNSMNPVNEVEIPYYTRKRFTAHRRLDWTSNPKDVGGFRAHLMGKINPKTSMDIYFATAEDFSTYFWVCPPPLRYSALLPDSS